MTDDFIGNNERSDLEGLIEASKLVQYYKEQYNWTHDLDDAVMLAHVSKKLGERLFFIEYIVDERVKWLRANHNEQVPFDEELTRQNIYTFLLSNPEYLGAQSDTEPTTITDEQASRIIDDLKSRYSSDSASSAE